MDNFRDLSMYSGVEENRRLQDTTSEGNKDFNWQGFGEGLQALGATLQDVSSNLRGEEPVALEKFSARLDKIKERLAKRRAEAEKIATGGQILDSVAGSLGKYLPPEIAQQHSLIMDIAKKSDDPLGFYSKGAGFIEDYKTMSDRARGRSLEEAIKEERLDKLEYDASMRDKPKKQDYLFKLPPKEKKGKFMGIFGKEQSEGTFKVLQGVKTKQDLEELIENREAYEAEGVDVGEILEYFMEKK